MGVLGQVVGADDEEFAPVLDKVLGGQAGRRDAEHDPEGHVRFVGHAPFFQVAAAVAHQLHGVVPVHHAGHHGEHDPQGADGAGPQQGADLVFEPAGLPQAGPDAPHPQMGGLVPFVDVGEGAVRPEIEGADGDGLAPRRRDAGGVVIILLLLVEGVAGQDLVIAAQQPHPRGPQLEGAADVLGAKAVGQQLEAGAVPGAAGHGADGRFQHVLLRLLAGADAGDGLLAGVGVGVQDAGAGVGVQHHDPAVAVVQEVPPHLDDAGDAPCPGNNGRMAEAAALRGDDAQDHPRGDAEQVAGHQLVRRQDDGVVEGEQDPRPPGQDVDHPLGGVQDIHVAQLQIGVVGHGQHLVGVALAHPVHGFGRAGAGLYVGAHLPHEGVVLQQHTLEGKDGLFAGRRPPGHRLELVLGDADRLFQHQQLLFGAVLAAVEEVGLPFEQADLPKHQPRRNGFALILLHAITSGTSGPVSARRTRACKNR